MFTQFANSRQTIHVKTCQLPFLTRTRREKRILKISSIVGVSCCITWQRCTAVVLTNRQYNKREQQFDKLEFLGDIGEVLGTLTFKAPIVAPYFPDMEIKIHQYLLAGIFVGDLDFLSNFLEHQGASARWLCMFYLACQGRLQGSSGTMSGKRQGAWSIQKCYTFFKREYLDLPEHEKTKAKKNKLPRKCHVILSVSR